MNTFGIDYDNVNWKRKKEPLEKKKEKEAEINLENKKKAEMEIKTEDKKKEETEISLENKKKAEKLQKKEEDKKAREIKILEKQKKAVDEKVEKLNKEFQVKKAKAIQTEAKVIQAKAESEAITDEINKKKGIISLIQNNDYKTRTTNLGFSDDLSNIQNHEEIGGWQIVSAPSESDKFFIKEIKGREKIFTSLEEFINKYTNSKSVNNETKISDKINSEFVPIANIILSLLSFLNISGATLSSIVNTFETYDELKNSKPFVAFIKEFNLAVHRTIFNVFKLIFSLKIAPHNDIFNLIKESNIDSDTMTLKTKAIKCPETIKAHLEVYSRSILQDTSSEEKALEAISQHNRNKKENATLCQLNAELTEKNNDLREENQELKKQIKVLKKNKELQIRSISPSISPSRYTMDAQDGNFEQLKENNKCKLRNAKSNFVEQEIRSEVISEFMVDIVSEDLKSKLGNINIILLDHPKLLKQVKKETRDKLEKDIELTKDQISFLEIYLKQFQDFQFQNKIKALKKHITLNALTGYNFNECEEGILKVEILNKVKYYSVLFEFIQNNLKEKFKNKELFDKEMGKIEEGLNIIKEYKICELEKHTLESYNKNRVDYLHYLGCENIHKKMEEKVSERMKINKHTACKSLIVSPGVSSNEDSEDNDPNVESIKTKRKTKKKKEVFSLELSPTSCNNKQSDSSKKEKEIEESQSGIYKLEPHRNIEKNSIIGEKNLEGLMNKVNKMQDKSDEQSLPLLILSAPIKNIDSSKADCFKSLNNQGNESIIKDYNKSKDQDISILNQVKSITDNSKSLNFTKKTEPVECVKDLKNDEPEALYQRENEDGTEALYQRENEDVHEALNEHEKDKPEALGECESFVLNAEDVRESLPPRQNEMESMKKDEPESLISEQNEMESMKKDEPESLISEQNEMESMKNNESKALSKYEKDQSEALYHHEKDRSKALSEYEKDRSEALSEYEKDKSEALGECESFVLNAEDVRESLPPRQNEMESMKNNESKALGEYENEGAPEALSEHKALYQHENEGAPESLNEYEKDESEELGECESFVLNAEDVRGSLLPRQNENKPESLYHHENDSSDEDLKRHNEDHDQDTMFVTNVGLLETVSAELT